jgi:hypothetical protein
MMNSDISSDLKTLLCLSASAYAGYHEDYLMWNRPEALKLNAKKPKTKRK